MLVEEGCGLDCSSTSELYLAKLLNVSGERVMFTSNYTSHKDLQIAYDDGVIINLDDISLISSLVQVRGRCPELICFRLNPGVGRTDSETASNVLGGPNAKFGIPPYQIVDAYRQAQAAGATRFGIHMMTGSCVMNQQVFESSHRFVYVKLSILLLKYWSETVGILFDVIVQLKQEVRV